MALSSRSLKNLEDVDPRLVALCKRVNLYIDFEVLCGWRNEEDQEAAFKAGTTKLHYPHGKHNKRPSKALDVAPTFVDVTRKVNIKDVPAIARLVGFFEATAYAMGIKTRLGMDWDGDWRSEGYTDPDGRFFDGFHIELVDP